MIILEESDTTHEKGGNIQNVHLNREQSTQTNNYGEEERTDDNPEFLIQQDQSPHECIYCFVSHVLQMKETDKCGGMIIQRPLIKEIQV